MRKTILALTVALILAGCATSYQSKGLMGGYSETQLAPNLFRVSFGGNGYTSGERAQDFTLLRAAELTLQSGFRYFIICDETNTTDVSTHTTPGYSYTSGSFYKGKYSSSTFYSPPTTYSIARPQSGLLIKCYVDKPESGNVMDAAFLQQSIASKYGIEQNITWQAKKASNGSHHQTKTQAKGNNNLVKEQTAIITSKSRKPTANNHQNQYNIQSNNVANTYYEEPGIEKTSAASQSQSLEKVNFISHPYSSAIQQKRQIKESQRKVEYEDAEEHGIFEEENGRVLWK